MKFKDRKNMDKYWKWNGQWKKGMKKEWNGRIIWNNGNKWKRNYL